jgi:hypothetical protein
VRQAGNLTSAAVRASARTPDDLMIHGLLHRRRCGRPRSGSREDECDRRRAVPGVIAFVARRSSGLGMTWRRLRQNDRVGPVSVAAKAIAAGLSAYTLVDGLRGALLCTGTTEVPHLPRIPGNEGSELTARTSHRRRARHVKAGRKLTLWRRSKTDPLWRLLNWPTGGGGHDRRSRSPWASLAVDTLTPRGQGRQTKSSRQLRDVADQRVRDGVYVR